jgi:dTDP-4-dehydrorhamnose 3,5-epimerase
MTTIPVSAPLVSTPLRLAIPGCEPGIGAVIATAAADTLIEGVRIEAQTIWPDDRGYFIEVARLGRGLVAGFPHDSTQVSATVSYPGTIKAFHYHQHQTDCWVPLAGMLQIALVDLREQSRTFGWKNTLYVGTLRPWMITIPPGVAHGYKVIGVTPASLIYVTDRHYDPGDEGRLPHDDSRLHYDWELQHK